MAIIIESITKNADKLSASINEAVTFDVVFNRALPNPIDVLFMDNLSSCLQFVPDTVTLDGVLMPGANPANGIAFHLPSGTHNLSFQARVVCRPADGIILNTAEVFYNSEGPHRVTSNTIQILIEVVACGTVAEQSFNVCVPVDVTPTATVGNITVRCCGPAIVNHGTDVCPGIPNGMCNFTVTQRLCAQVPVQFGANVTPGEPRTLCQDIGCADCV